jgi:hypothetical protein
MAKTSVDLNAQAEALYDEICRGENERSVADLFGWDDETFKAIRARMMEMKVHEERSKPREIVFMEYKLDQEANIRDLNTVIKKLKTSRNMEAASVGAIRLRSDIQDKIVAKAQEFGMVKKEPTRSVLLHAGGVMVAEMSKDALQGAIMTELSSMRDMMEKYGDKPISAMPTAKALHYGAQARLHEAVETEGEAVEVVEKKKGPKK